MNDSDGRIDHYFLFLLLYLHCQGLQLIQEDLICQVYLACPPCLQVQNRVHHQLHLHLLPLESPYHLNLLGYQA